MNKSTNKENQIAQVEVNPNFPEVPDLPTNIPSGVGINGMTCFVLALTVFYKAISK